MEAIN
jgi:ribonuclease HI